MIMNAVIQVEPCDCNACPAEVPFSETFNPHQLREPCSVAAPDFRSLLRGYD